MKKKLKIASMCVYYNYDCVPSTHRHTEHEREGIIRLKEIELTFFSVFFSKFSPSVAILHLFRNYSCNSKQVTPFAPKRAGRKLDF